MAIRRLVQTAVLLPLVLALACSDKPESLPTSTVAVPEDVSVLVIGDSILDWHKWNEAAVSDVLEEELGRSVHDASVSGALFSSLNPDIRAQYVERDWDWLILNGGGNDLDACGCNSCESTLEALISEDGSKGLFPKFLDDEVNENVRVIILGYYSFAEGSFDHCNELVGELSKRQELLAELRSNVWFLNGVPLTDVEDPGDYDSDGTHPSVATSRRMGEALGDLIVSVESEMGSAP